jgi:diguanylate cyclase (GGDEF)-like protein
VLTYGYYPLDRRDAIADEYSLSEFPQTRLVLTGQQEVVVDVDDPGADPNEVEYVQSLGQRWMVMLPLVARGTSVGLVELVWSSPRRADARRLERARKLVAEAATALDNARLYDELRRSTLHDGLTGLPNRALFRDRLLHTLSGISRRPGQHVAVIVLNIDDFGGVNDLVGHAAADRLLVEVGLRLTAAMRPGDTVARLGGDEFGVLLDDLSAREEATRIAGRMLAAVSDADAGLALRASAGLAHTTAGRALTPMPC